MSKLSAIVILATCLTACVSHTSVQSDYVVQRNNCRELAVLKQELYTQELENLNQQDRNAQLLTLFGHCMYERGWTVAAPVQKPRPPSDPLPGSQLQVPVTPEGESQISSEAVSQISPLQTREIDSRFAPESASQIRQIPVENEAVEGVGAPTNATVQTPF